MDVVAYLSMPAIYPADGHIVRVRGLMRRLHSEKRHEEKIYASR
jgi:hypothetical protein